MKAKVVEMQVGGLGLCASLCEACSELLDGKTERLKIHFLIELPDGRQRTITIRDRDGETVAYGDFEGLPSFMDYAKE